MSVRPDNRLRDAPMTPVTCGSCGARVLARKSSWEQTSVQWSAAALGLCRTRAQMNSAPALGERAVGESCMFLSCPALRTSIEAAACAGQLPVLDNGHAGS